MNLSKINKNYLYIAFAAFLLSGIVAKSLFWEFYIYTVLLAIGFIIVVLLVSEKSDDFYTKKNLTMWTAICLIGGVSCNLLLSQGLNNNLFVFSEADARFYFENALWLREQPFLVTFEQLRVLYPYEDWGGIFLIALIVRLIPSKLFLNAIYIVLAVLSARMMYDIGKNIMNTKYSFLAALTFSISSFTVFFTSSSLKEPFMVVLSVAAFHYFYKYLQDKQSKHLIIAIVWASLLLFFRPAILFFLLATGFMTIVYSLRISSVKLYSTLVLIGVIVVGLSSIIGDTMTRYIGTDSTQYYDKLDYAASGTSLSIGISLMVSALATLIGPFPAMIPKVNYGIVSYLSLFGPGLIYRMLLALPFWMGGIVCFKYKLKMVLPLLFFPVLEMLSLSLILEGLELRLHMPHMPMVFLLAFWGMYIVDSRQWLPQRWLRNLINFWPLAVAMLAVLWNFR